MTVLDATIKAPFGVVDMGSNGIRFGIVTALARHLPVAYEERAPISLLEAQGDEHYIPAETIDQVITSFLRFKTVCRHEDVDPANVRVIATEATRIATNSNEFLSRIKEATGWSVSILSKEQEAMISSMGIVGKLSSRCCIHRQRLNASVRLVLQSGWINNGLGRRFSRDELRYVQRLFSFIRRLGKT